MRRCAAVLLCAFFLLPCVLCTASAEAETEYASPEPEVTKIDLFVQPYHYLQMIPTAEKEKHPAMVCIDGGDARQIDEQLRSASAVDEGLSLSARSKSADCAASRHYLIIYYFSNQTVLSFVL